MEIPFLALVNININWSDVLKWLFLAALSIIVFFIREDRKSASTKFDRMDRDIIEGLQSIKTELQNNISETRLDLSTQISHVQVTAQSVEKKIIAQEGELAHIRSDHDKLDVKFHTEIKNQMDLRHDHASLHREMETKFFDKIDEAVERLEKKIEGRKNDA